jgi:transposase
LAYYVGRELIALGHDVKQVPPAYAKPFRQGHKNDFRDAHAIAEAVQRPTTRCVPVKTGDQLDLQALHRVRSRLISGRTAVINQIRGFLLEHGIPVRQGLQLRIVARGRGKTLHHNVLATALANKLARIAWTVLTQGRNYETRVMAEGGVR